jgi:phage major head subunit gpT-like protein
MAQACARRMDDQVVQFYISGFAATLGVTYDNQFLYDTDHTAAGNGLGAQQNNLIDRRVRLANFNTGLQKAMLFVDDEGEPIGINIRRRSSPGRSSSSTLRQVLKQEFQAGGATNIDAGMASYLISPRITGTHWFMLSDEEIKSVILGIEVEPQFVAADNPRAFEMFMRRNALYGSHTKFGLCYGMWQSRLARLARG